MNITVVACWFIRAGHTEGLITLDDEGRPIGVWSLQDDLTAAATKRLTSPTVLNAIAAQRALDITT